MLQHDRQAKSNGKSPGMSSIVTVVKRIKLGSSWTKLVHVKAVFLVGKEILVWMVSMMMV